MRAVRFDRYGGPEVLEVREVERPVPGAGEALVAVRAAAINPGEISIREGLMHERFPATFPSGEGSDLAGVVEELGPDASEPAVGTAVCGWTDKRASHAELVVVPVSQLTRKPDAVPWEVAGSMFVAPMAAYASVHSVAPRPGEVVVVSAAAGGVGSLAVQLAKRTGGTVIGLASDYNHAWLRSHGVVPVAYGEGVAGRIRDAAGGHVDAFIDTFGHGYVALAQELGVPRDRINTIADFPAIARRDARGEGTSSVARVEVLREIVELVARGELEIPIARTCPLAEVRAAYEELAQRKTHGKIVLIP